MGSNSIIDHNVKLEWICHDCFKIKDMSSGKIVYTDPYELNKYKGNLENADVILVTHSHYDHFDLESIKIIAREDTMIFVPSDVIGKLKFGQVTSVKPNMNFNIGFMSLETIPAYNTNKPYHPRSKNWVGYIINIDDIRIYHAGDTDIIPEMNNLKRIDIALLPVSGTYVMNPEEAAKACSIIKPKLAIPMHYGSGIGTEEDAIKFKQLANCEVKILKNIKN